MNKNLGVIIEKKPKDWVGGSITYQINNPTGDWTPYLPKAENQYTHHTDSMACVTFSCLNVIETQLKFLTGVEYNFSDRFIAKLSGTTPQGNSVQNVLDAIKKYGLVLEEEWPTDIEFNWDQYYADIPASVIAKARKIDFDYEFHWPSFTDFSKELKQVPLEMIIVADNPYHSVEMINTSNYFDHYSPYIKPQPSIYLTTKIVLKGISMSNTIFGHKAGTQEYGFWVPATTVEALKDKALNFGLPITKADGSIDFTQAKEINGL